MSHLLFSNLNHHDQAETEASRGEQARWWADALTWYEKDEGAEELLPVPDEGGAAEQTSGAAEEV